MPAVGVDAFGDLRCEFAGGSENEGADLLIAGAPTFDKAIEEGEGETGCLSSAGLGGGHDITTRHHGRNGFYLNGERRGVALFLNGFKDPGIEPKFAECHVSGVVDLLVWRGVAPDCSLTVSPKREEVVLSKDEMSFRR